MTEQATLFDAAKAVAAAAEGMDRAARAERVQEWRARADAWFEELYVGTVVQADDLIAAVGLPDPEATPASNNAVGAWFSAKSKAGQITFTGHYRRSERVVGHGNLQRRWRKT